MAIDFRKFHNYSSYFSNGSAWSSKVIMDSKDTSLLHDDGHDSS